MKAPGTLSLSDSSTWPIRMTLAEVAYVSRKSVRTIQRRIRQGLMFNADSDGLFEREAVAKYLRGGIRIFEKDVANAQRYAARSMSVVAR